MSTTGNYWLELMKWKLIKSVTFVLIGLVSIRVVVCWCLSIGRTLQQRLKQKHPTLNVLEFVLEFVQSEPPYLSPYLPHQSGHHSNNKHVLSPVLSSGKLVCGCSMEDSVEWLQDVNSSAEGSRQNACLHTCFRTCLNPFIWKVIEAIPGTTSPPGGQNFSMWASAFPILSDWLVWILPTQWRNVWASTTSGWFSSTLTSCCHAAVTSSLVSRQRAADTVIIQARNTEGKVPPSIKPS